MLTMVVVMSSMVCVSTLPVVIYVHVNRDSSLKRTANSSAKVRSQIKRHIWHGHGELNQYFRPDSRCFPESGLGPRVPSPKQHVFLLL